MERAEGLQAERHGALRLLPRLKLRPATVGGDKGFFEQTFIQGLLRRRIQPHIAVYARGRSRAHTRVRMRQRGAGYQWSQRARKKIEELWGEAKEEHGFRRFFRRTLDRVRQEAWRWAGCSI